MRIAGGIGRIDYCVYWPLSKQAVHPCNRKATRQSPLKGVTVN